ncbi:MAG: hypothetical protein M1829_000466 [Trizodia sp. TS-e1964]|nr:MAG: hypothetical protein M1829_000466 [Trizodia sp. TS-e1964]
MSMIAGVKQRQPLTAPAARTQIPNISLFLTNLRLLNLDQLDDWPDITPQTFAPKDSQRTKIKCVEWALYRLFELWDTEETRNKLDPFFPPLEPLQSLNLRAALFRSLSELKKNGVLGRDSVLRKTMLDECKGDRFEEMLLSFSTAVLKKVSCYNHQDKALAYQLAVTAPLSKDDEWLLEPLKYTHEASISKAIQRKGTLRARYNDIAQLLSLKERRMFRREEQLKASMPITEQKDQIPDDEARAIRKEWQDNWVADQKWLKLIFSGKEYQEEDAILDASFEEVWSHVLNGEVGEMEIRGEPDLLSELDRRIRAQKGRLDKWENFYRDFNERHKPSLKELASTDDAPKRPGMDLGFNQHQNMNIKNHLTSKKENSFTDSTGDESENTSTVRKEYEIMINSMLSDISKAGKSRVRGNRDHQRIEEEMDQTTAVSDPIQSIQKDITIPIHNQRNAQNNKKSSNLPILTKESLSKQTSSLTTKKPPDDTSFKTLPKTTTLPEPPKEDKLDPNPDEYLSLPVERKDVASTQRPQTKEVPMDISKGKVAGGKKAPSNFDDYPQPVVKEYSSLVERTRKSMAPSRHKIEDNSASEPIPVPDAEIKDEITDAARSQILLAERTRQSMASFQPSAKPRKTTKQPRQQAKPAFLPPFQTPQKADDQVVLSKDPTPPESLFNKEADYASVFKSRPKIALSPALTPQAGEDLPSMDSITLGADDGADDGNEMSWQNSPLARAKGKGGAL